MKNRKWIFRIIGGICTIVVLLIIVTLIAGQFAKNQVMTDYPPPGQMIDVGGYQLHLHCIGDGSPTIITEAGLNEFSLTWSRVQDSLAETTRVCVYDRAGFGWSDESPLPRTVDNIVSELHILLSTAGIDTPYIMVGHSFGGILVRAYTNRYPDDVAGMVLIDASHEDMIALRPDLFEPSTGQLLSQFQSLVIMQNTGILALAPEEIPAPDYPDTAVEQYRAILAGTNYFETAIAESEMFADNLASMQDMYLEDLPLIVISRGQPEPLPFMDDSSVDELETLWSDLQVDLLNLSNNSQHIIAENSGHYIQLSEPDVVINAIRALVLSLR